MKNLFFILFLLLPLCVYANFGDDFSNSSLSDTWSGDRSSFIIEDNVLKLNASGDSAGIASLSCVSTVSENATWTIKGKMNFKPSSNNYCQIYLISDAVDLSKVSNGIFLQLGSSQKVISLHRVFEGKKLILGKSVEDRIAFDTVSFEVMIKKTKENLFEVFSKINNETEFTNDFSVSDPFGFVSQFFHLNCVYTKTRSKAFSFDYVKIEGESGDFLPLELVSKQINERSLDLVFNRSIDAENVSVFVNDSTTVDYVVDYNKLVVFADFIAENVNGEVNFSVCDYSGNCVSDKVKIAFNPIPKSGEVIINEIMFDPQIGGAEYLELFNNTSQSFSLKDLLLAKPSNSLSSAYTFYSCAENDEILAPHGYALLSKDADAVCTMNECGDGVKVSLSKFPALNNEGGYLFLFNKDTLLLDSVFFDKKMHTVLSSKTKGVSLERSCESNQFYSSSSASPCALNSICGERDNSDEKEEYVKMNNSVITFGSEQVQIEYVLPFENAYLIAVVYDKDGREIKKLSSEEKVDSIGEILWDGTDNNGNNVKPSPYMIFVNFYTTERKGGIRKRFLCTIGAR